MVYIQSDPKGYYVAFFGPRGSKKFDYWRSRTMPYGRAVNLKFRIEKALKRFKRPAPAIHPRAAEFERAYREARCK